MSSVPSVHNAVVHRAAILQRAANPPDPEAHPAAPVRRPFRLSDVPWDVIGLFILMGVSLGYALVHLAHH